MLTFCYVGAAPVWWLRHVLHRPPTTNNRPPMANLCTITASYLGTLRHLVSNSYGAMLCFKSYFPAISSDMPYLPISPERG